MTDPGTITVWTTNLGDNVVYRHKARAQKVVDAMNEAAGAHTDDADGYRIIKQLLDERPL